MQRVVLKYIFLRTLMHILHSYNKPIVQLINEMDRNDYTIFTIFLTTELQLLAYSDYLNHFKPEKVWSSILNVLVC